MDEEKRIEQKHLLHLQPVFWSLGFGIDNFKDEVILITEDWKPPVTLLSACTTSLKLWFFMFVLWVAEFTAQLQQDALQKCVCSRGLALWDMATYHLLAIAMSARKFLLEVTVCAPEPTSIQAHWFSKGLFYTLFNSAVLVWSNLSLESDFHKMLTQRNGSVT